MFGRKSVYGKHTETQQETLKKQPLKLYKHKKANQVVNKVVKNVVPKNGTTIDSFELEYQKFIEELKAKKAAKAIENTNETEQESTEEV